MLTGDLNMAIVEWIVQFTVKDPVQFAFRVRDSGETIRNMSEAVMRLVIGDHTINEVLTAGREEIQAAVEKKLQEVRVAKDSALKTGDQVKADIFTTGDRVDVCGVSKGKGFQGVIKRYHFAGGPAAHGSMFHRAPGSIGQRQTPAKVYPGKRMPGRMGNDRTTVRNLEVVNVDAERNLLIIRGCVPGATGGIVTVSKTTKGKK